MDTRRSADRHAGLAVDAALVAFSAYAGAISLAGSGADMGHELNHRLPFHSPVFGALALVIIVAVPATALAWHATRNDERTGATTAFAGAMLVV